MRSDEDDTVCRRRVRRVGGLGQRGPRTRRAWDCSEVKLTLKNREPFTCIRQRNYERDLSDVRVSQDDVLEPVGVDRIEGVSSAVDAPRRSGSVKAGK